MPRSVLDMRYVITCEHASAQVPKAFAHCFKSRAAQKALHSHRGIDFGAQAVARYLKTQINCPYFEGTMTRLLIELNRTRKHPQLFSSFSRNVSPKERQTLLDAHFRHVSAVEQAIIQFPSRALVRHLGVHSFTPVWHGVVRATDIGLLYDPARRFEKAWAHELRDRLKGLTDFKVHLNQPYRGTSDGLTKYFRHRLPDSRYAGIELEINQRLLETSAQKRAMARLLHVAFFQQ